MRRLTLMIVIGFLCAKIPAIGQSAPGYRKGTIQSAGSHTLKVSGNGLEVWIGRCGDLQPGESVEFSVDHGKAYIQGSHGTQHTCAISRMETIPSGAASLYQPGEILGYMIRRDTVESTTRWAKVYELRGSKFMYLIDYCGAFQAGKFLPGEHVQFRVAPEEDRLYVRHGTEKSWSCRLEGMRLRGTKDHPAARGWW
jgi:hypothetical protein